jgi:cytochrome c biogenesis protein CcdA
MTGQLLGYLTGNHRRTDLRFSKFADSELRGGGHVSSALLYGYSSGWVLTSILLALLAWRLLDKDAQTAHPALLSFVAGAAWPLLVVALAEAGAVALTVEVLHDEGLQPSLVS